MSQPAFAQLVNITVPPSSKWEPEIAHEMLVQLFTIPGWVRLMIVARSHEITWWVEIPFDQVEAVSNVIFRYYPQAQIETRDRRNDPTNFKRFDFRTVHPFPRPLLTAVDSKQHDPLVSLVRALSNLKENETIFYELFLTPVSDKHFELGVKVFGSLNTPDVGGPKIRIMESKMGAPLKRTELAFKIMAGDPERINDILNLINPGLAVFDRDWFNYLVPSVNGGYDLVLSPGEVAALWHPPNEQYQIPKIDWARGAHTPLPAEVAKQKDGLFLGANHYQGQPQQVYLQEKVRSTHINVIGKTEMGKTTLLHHLIHQDIAAGRGVGVIDPHGDLIDNILKTSIPPGQEKHVCLVDLTDKEFPVGLNVFAAPDDATADEVAGQILSVIKKQFADNWSETRMETALYAALRSLVEYPEATIQDVPRLFYNPGFRAEVLTKVSDPTTLSYWYDQYDLASEGMQRQIAEPIINRVNKFYRHETTRRLMAQKQSQDFRKILDEGTIFLAKLTNVPESEAEVLGTLLVSKFQLAAMSRANVTAEERLPYYLYIDEVQKFITTSLPEVFSEARKYGLRLTVANQFLGQLRGETLEAIMGNVGTNITFRVGSKDAKALAPFMTPTYKAQDLTGMSQFHAAIKTQVDGTAQPPFSIQTNEPLPIPNDAAARVAAIRAASRQQYARPQAEVDAELLARYHHINAKQEQEDDKLDFYD